MISVDEADKIILDSIDYSNLVEEVKLTASYNRILAEDISSDRKQPAFDRVTMDGISIPYYLYKSGLRKFRIQDNIQKAGIEAYTLNKDYYDCIEVMTGAKIPNDTDTVIKYEDLNINLGIAELKENIEINYKQNIHFKGSDYNKGQLLMNKGIKIEPIQVSILASIGKSIVKVFKEPNIAIIATGDELVDIDKEVLDYQIRVSNPYSIQCALKINNFNNSTIFLLKDNKDILLNSIDNILNSFDFVIISGGVSAGKFDFIPDIMRKLKVKEIFHKVKQKPGKPLWFGKNDKNIIVFGLPGNPISAIICLYRYVLPCLNKKYNRISNQEYISISDDIEIGNRMTNFFPVKTNINNASIIKINTSGDYYSSFLSSGFIEVKENTSFIKSGTILKYFRW